MPRGELHTRRTPRRHSHLTVVGENGRDGRTPFERLHGKKPSVPLNRMNLRCKFGVWLGVNNNSAECFVGTAEGVFRVCEVRRLEQKDR